MNKSDARDIRKWKNPVDRPISHVYFDDKGRRYRAVITTHDLLSMMDAMGREALQLIIDQSVDYAEEVI